MRQFKKHNIRLKEFLNEFGKLSITVMDRGKLPQIKVQETNTAARNRVKLTGKLDILQHSKQLLGILVEGKSIRARLSDRMHMDELVEYFGKDVSLSGVANFNPSGSITSFEIEGINKAKPEDNYFRRLPQPIFKDFDIQEIKRKKNDKGKRLDGIIGKWPGTESTDELLELLT